MKTMTTIEELELELKLAEDEAISVEKALTIWKNRQIEVQKKIKSLNNDINTLKSNRIANDLKSDTYEWSAKVKEILKNKFQLEHFRRNQLLAINATLSGQNAIVIMPTGAGKSLCYQLPALVKPGLTVVISPLISLMEDQVLNLTKKNIPTVLISKATSVRKIKEVLNALKYGLTDIKLVYVTPERFAQSKLFLSVLQTVYADGRLQRIAIDEVHCCSQWGHDFRPDYKFLGILSGMFPRIPILGLTATATKHILDDIQQILNISNSLIIKSTFNRPNLFYKILEKPKSQQKCIEILENLLRGRYIGKSGIIYTHSIKDCEDITKELRQRGLAIGAYHSKLNASTRSEVHQKWHNNEYQAIVGTIAFGMGIDKPDVRFIIHYTISKSMENYYQESGRAGRDGQYAECVTLYRMQDIFKVSTMVFANKNGIDHLYGMVDYCLNGLCRRSLIAKHFNEDWIGDARCTRMCDICCNPYNVQDINVKIYCSVLREIINNADEKLTAQKLLNTWSRKIKNVFNMPYISEINRENVIALLLVKKCLIEDFYFTPYTKISYIKTTDYMDSVIEDKRLLIDMSVPREVNFDLNSFPNPLPFPLIKDQSGNDSLMEMSIEDGGIIDD